MFVKQQQQQQHNEWTEKKQYNNQGEPIFQNILLSSDKDRCFSHCFKLVSYASYSS